MATEKREVLMTMTTATQPQTWLPEQIGSLVVQPVQKASVAIQAVGSVGAGARVNSYRVPIVTADPTAAWTAEGEEITVSEASLGEDVDTFHKLAGLTIISSELANDSSPDVAEQVGLGLARDIARKLDSAFFGTRSDSTVQPRGLGDITGISTVDAGSAWTNTDPFAEAQAAAEDEGATIASFVANPADVLSLAKIKRETGSNEPLLQPDPTQPARRTIVGVPLLVSSAVTQGTIWSLPGAGRIVIAIREDVSLARDTSAYFTSDRVAIRATMRVTTLFPHPASIVKIALSA
jgi:HK97 family phage major capsid protein